MKTILERLASTKARLAGAGGAAPIERTLLLLAILLTAMVIGIVVGRAFGHREVADVVAGYRAMSGVNRANPSRVALPPVLHPSATNSVGDIPSATSSPATAEGKPIETNPVIAARLRRINDRRLLSPPQAAIQLSGILGDEAIFNGDQAVKVGGTILNGRVTKINADSVELLIDGRPTTLHVFAPAPAAGADMSGQRRGGFGAAGSGAGWGGRGPGSPPRQRSRELTPAVIARFKSMPAAERERLLKRIEERDPEMAQKLRQAL
jgi:hypothetical protein